jgi:histone H3/H4
MSDQNRYDGNVEDILGQFYYAFGQGAGQMRVGRPAIAALRNRYLDPIRSAQDRWKSVSPNVLAFVAQVGRLAALFATHAGRTAIDEADFMAARRTVEARVHQSADHAGIFIAGPLCPILPEEQSLPPAGDGCDTDSTPMHDEDAGPASDVPRLH